MSVKRRPGEGIKFHLANGEEIVLEVQSITPSSNRVQFRCTAPNGVRFEWIGKPLWQPRTASPPPEST